MPLKQELYLKRKQKPAHIISALETSGHMWDMRTDMTPWVISNAPHPGMRSFQLCQLRCGLYRDKKREAFLRALLGKKGDLHCGFLQPEPWMENLSSRKTSSLPVLTQTPSLLQLVKQVWVISLFFLDLIALDTKLTGCLIQPKFISNVKLPTWKVFFPRIPELIFIP